jgi:small subunit ribosomal protein S3
MMQIVNDTYGVLPDLPAECPKEERSVYIHTCLSNASAISTYIVQGLEERKPLKQIYKSISRECNPKYNAKIKGIRVSCSGRLEGGEIASTHTYKDGETSVHRLRNTIDYAYKDANTVYGVIGVKVWLTYA